MSVKNNNLYNNKILIKKDRGVFMSSKENVDKILQNAAHLTFSNLLLSGDADVRIVNKKPQVYIYKNTTVSGIMESLYILDNLGVDTEELALDSSIFNFEEGVDISEIIKTNNLKCIC